jgi:hypothetical protein
MRIAINVLSRRHSHAIIRERRRRRRRRRRFVLYNIH